MTAAFIEVLHDLWLFAFGRSAQKSSYYERAEIGSAAISRPENLTLAVPAITSDMVEGRSAFVISHDARCFQHPKVSYDTAVGSLTYAEEVKVDVIQDGYAHVFGRQCTGWVETTHLTDDKNMILPQLKSAYEYSSANEETIKLRTYIDDEFLGGQLALPLQPAEYVHYCVMSEMHRFSWPSTRPREAGRWQSILRGQTGVHMSIEPKTGSVLEYAGSEGRSFLAYVESVKPDLSISISSVGRLKDGEYLKEEVTPERWREWRPVFISFS